MASLRSIRKQNQEKRKIALPKSKVGKAAAIVANKKTPKEQPEEKKSYLPANLPDKIGNAQRVEAQRKENDSRALTVQKETNERASKTFLDLKEQRDKSADWIGGEPKFKTEGTTVLFPADFEKIRKVIREELVKFKAEGGFGGGGGVGEDLAAAAAGAASRGAGGIAKKILKGAGRAVAVGAAAYSGYDLISNQLESTRDAEEKLRKGEITKEEADRIKEETNRESTYGVAGGVIGGGLGLMFGGFGAAAGASLGIEAGRWIAKHTQGNESKPKVSADTKHNEKVLEAIDKVSKKFDVDADLMKVIAMQESSMNPNATSKNSNAAGLFQFLPETWNNLRKNFPKETFEEGIGIAIKGGVDDRLNPYKSAVMYALLRKENMSSLRGATTGAANVDVYIMHLLGAPTGKKVIVAYNETPDEKINKVVGDAPYNSNRELMTCNGKVATVAEFVQNIRDVLSKRKNDVKKFEDNPKADEAPKTSVTANSATGEVNASAGVDMTGLSPAMKNAVEGLAADVQATTGQKLNVTSAFRSYDKQAQLYAANPKLAAKPGTSMHEKGLAIDASSSQLNAADNAGLLEKNGLTRPVAGEPWHVELKGARNAVKGRSSIEEKIESVSTSSTPNAPMVPTVIVQQVPVQQTQQPAVNGQSVSLTTRNDDLIYTTVKLQEAARTT
jgi:hypothetical protein